MYQGIFKNIFQVAPDQFVQSNNSACHIKSPFIIVLQISYLFTSEWPQVLFITMWYTVSLSKIQLGEKVNIFSVIVPFNDV